MRYHRRGSIVVGHGFDGYERELRSLLAGDPSSVRSYARGLPPVEREEFERLIEEPFLVVRGAGSLGLDLVALRREFALPIEVKASSAPVIRFTAAGGRANAQLEQHRRVAARAGLMVLYAYRRLGLRGQEPWRVFSAGNAPGRGLLGVACRALPPVEATREGNGVLRWDGGMPLSQFLGRLRYLSRRTEPLGG
jgi:Holliday junction resolvase